MMAHGVQRFHPHSSGLISAAEPALSAINSSRLTILRLSSLWVLGNSKSHCLAFALQRRSNWPVSHAKSEALRFPTGAKFNRLRTVLYRWVSESFDGLSAVKGFFLAVCSSTIRRTSSATGTPSSFASRFRESRCGSVKEIICFVMAPMIPQGIPC